jgi:hypothetical protein
MDGGFFSFAQPRECMKFTMFRSLYDREKVDSEHEWQEIVGRARAPREYRQKRDMPLIKFALFGDQRSTEGLLRNGANMRQITGVEGDYDAEQMAPEDACTTLGMAGVTALLYTTPSYTPTAPRWRVLAPLSADHPPDARTAFLGRINGLLGGVLAPESFVPAQSYYWGRIAGGEYLALEARGACVDTLTGLDAGAIMPAAPPERPTGPPPSHVSLIEGGRNRGLFEIGSGLRRRNLSPEAILAALLAENLARCVPPLPENEVRVIARSASQYTPTVDYVTNGEAAPTERRIEVVPTGVLIPRSVLRAQEMRLDSLADLPLSKSQAGIYHDTITNCEVIMQATLNGRLWLDRSTGFPMRGPRLLNDIDSYHETAVIGALPGGHGIKDRNVYKAMQLIAHRNPIDPWQDWLGELRWDGVERLTNMSERYFGVSVGADGLEQLMWRKLMVAVVARQFHPGAKFDAMIVLEGAQGTRKSTALRALFGSPYVASWEHDFNTKDFLQQLQGNVCIEIADLASLQRTEMNAVKAILSQTVDVYRPTYARSVERRPRRCVMVGTSNDRSYLTDPTGNRRFWPLQCTAIDTDALLADREQLFAEAVAAFRAGGEDANWWLLPGRVVEEQATRLIEDPWTDRLRNFLVGRSTVQTFDLMHRPLEIPIERQTTGSARRIGGILRQLGWILIHTNSGNYWRPRVEDDPPL